MYKWSAAQQWGCLAFSAGAGLLFKAVGSFIWPTESSAWFLLAASLGGIAAGVYLLHRDRSI
ncbi:hypothetical protein FNU79_14270 [Deinococcus detaillensis]|uniref:Uncharacterized protein n=1 Tax=Deinococcus detaillensis TaxID=2592048 RepID=A0A553UPC5_9DEIO|nr:hypothetical protein [Deinococcus detaillensis]TSA82056.1 hypothetical protein FNU79_14270 [Deinococcus detaillensis]